MIEGGNKLLKQSKDFAPNKPLISIVTIAYNEVNTIERTIKSVLSQTYKNIEYIIVDGGSTDGTVNILKRYDDKITYWRSCHDKGRSDAFNIGISLCKGTLIGMINAGDWYEKDTVRLVVESYLKSRDVSIFHGELKMYSPDGNYLFTLKPDTNPQNLFFQMIYNHPTCFVQKSAYETIGHYNLDYKIAMDYDIMMRFYSKGHKFMYLRQVLSNMLLGGISDKKMIQSYKEELDIQRKFGVGKLRLYFNYYLKCLRFYIKKCFRRNGIFLRLIRRMSSRKEL